MFADYIKNVHRINFKFEADLLQSDLNTLFEWCSNNNLILNINEYQKMSFSKARVFPSLNYHINTEIHRTMMPIKDISILFDHLLKFHCQINNIINGSNKILRLIHHKCFVLTNKLALKSIYITLWRTSSKKKKGFHTN